MQKGKLTARAVFGAFLVFILWIMVQPANAQFITTKEKCDSELKNVKTMYAGNNLGPKVDKIVADLKEQKFIVDRVISDLEAFAQDNPSQVQTVDNLIGLILNAQ